MADMAPSKPGSMLRILCTSTFSLLEASLFITRSFQYIDKTTLSYAAIFGIKDDLHLSGSEYRYFLYTCSSRL